MKEILTKKYPEVMNSGIEVRMWYCEQHKEYFSNNCSECMLLANDPDTIKQTRQATLREVGEWLEKSMDSFEGYTPTNDPDYFGEQMLDYIKDELIAKLKNGSMPCEDKGN